MRFDLCLNINKFFLYIIFLIFSAIILSQPYTAQALTEQQRRLSQKGIYYYDIEQNGCDPSSDNTTTNDLSPGNGSPNGTEFPKLDPSSMANAINKYIEKNYPNSTLKGLGETIVASSSNSNINPFLIVSIAQKESQMADAGDYNVRNGNNGFGRTATSSQPHFIGARTWYKWSSPKASVDYTAPENKKTKIGDMPSYLRNSGFYTKALKTNDITKLMKTYAPPSENDTLGYVNEIKKTTASLTALANGSTVDSPSDNPAANDVGTVSGGDGCCAIQSDVSVDGVDPKSKIWNMLTQEMGFTPLQAAGIMGNIEQESGFNPTALNPSSGAYGIVQWRENRKTALEQKASQKGVPISNIDVQLEHFKDELNTSYKSSVTDPIKKSNNLAEVTRIFLEKFEVPCTPGSSACDNEMNIRLPNAQKLQNGPAGSTEISATPASVCGNNTPIVLSNIEIKKLPRPMATPGGKITPKGITLHWWGTNTDSYKGNGIQTLVSWLGGNSSCGAGGCSVQVGITKEGEVYQMTRDLLDLTYHAKGGNSTTIGIEIEGGPGDFGKDGIAKQPKKYAAVVATVKALMEKYNIPLEGVIECDNVSGVHSHKDLAKCGNQGKTDIDNYYFDQVIKDIKGAN